MVKRKTTIPALVYRGTPVGFGAIPDGNVYSGQLLQVTGWGINSGADYTPTGSGSYNNVVPKLKAVSAADVAVSGIASGTIYKIVGVALGNAPLQDQYQQLQAGKPLADPYNATLYAIPTDTDVRRFAWISVNDAVQVWLPYSGAVPSPGDFLTLSSGVDGAVSVTSTPDTVFTVGNVLGYKKSSQFSGVTVSGIDAYVLTVLDFKY